MPRNLARLTPLQVRKQLLVATAQVQRAQLVADWEHLQSYAHILAGNARQRMQTAGIAVAVISLAAAALSSARRPRGTARPIRFSALNSVLPLVRLAFSLWVAHRTAGRPKSP
jgi:hypothetical protein